MKKKKIRSRKVAIYLTFIFFLLVAMPDGTVIVNYALENSIYKCIIAKGENIFRVLVILGTGISWCYILVQEGRYITRRKFVKFIYLGPCANKESLINGEIDKLENDYILDSIEKKEINSRKTEVKIEYSQLNL